MGALQPGVWRVGIGWDCITANMLLFSRLVNVFSGPCYPEAYECSVPEAPVLASPVSLTGSPAA